MTNKLFVIINSLKVPKIKKILLCEIKFLCTILQLPPEPLIRGLPPSDPRSLCPLSSTETPPPEQNSWVRHCLKIDSKHVTLQRRYTHIRPHDATP